MSLVFVLVEATRNPGIHIHSIMFRIGIGSLIEEVPRCGGHALKIDLTSSQILTCLLTSAYVAFKETRVPVSNICIRYTFAGLSDVLLNTLLKNKTYSSDKTTHTPAIHQPCRDRYTHRRAYGYVYESMSSYTI